MSSPADEDPPSTGEDASYEQAFSDLFRRFWRTEPTEAALPEADAPAVPPPAQD